MPSIDQLARVEITAKTTGVAQSTAELNALKGAQDKLAVSGAALGAVTDNSAKRQLAAAEAYKRQTLSLDDNARMHQYAARAIKVATDAYNQGTLGVVGSTAAHDALNKRISDINLKYGQAGTFATAYAQTLGGIKNQLQGVASSFGSAGSSLAAFGVAGLAAGVALGGLAIAFNYMTSAAERFGEKAIELRRFAEATGLTIDQVRALRSAAHETGVETESLQGWLTKFTISLDRARDGVGPLADMFRKLGGNLLEDMELTQGTSASIDVLARAAAMAGPKLNTMLREAFGRGSAEAGIILKLVEEAGGVDKLIERYTKLQKGTAAQVEEAAKLEIQLKRVREQADNAFAKMFSADVLRGEIFFYETLAKIAGALKIIMAARQFANPRGGPASTFGLTKDQLDSAGNSLFTASSSTSEPNSPVASSKALYENIRTLTEALGAAATPAQKLEEELKKVDTAWEDGKFGAKGSTEALNNWVLAINAVKSADVAKSLGEVTSALGSAATPAEKLAQRLADLATKENQLTAAQMRRAKAAAALDVQIEAEGARLGLLGNLASVGEQVALVQLQINKANAAGANITREQTEALKDKARIQATAAKPENQIALERQLLLLTDEEGQIRQKLIGWGIEFNGALGQTYAQQLRITGQLKQSIDLTTTFAAGLAKDLANGVKPMDALVNASKQLVGTLIDMSTKNLVQQAFGGLVGGTSNGLTAANSEAAMAPVVTASTGLMAACVQGGAALAAAIDGAVTKLQTVPGLNPLQANAQAFGGDANFGDRFFLGGGALGSIQKSIKEGALAGTEAGATAGIVAGVKQAQTTAATEGAKSSTGIGQPQASTASGGFSLFGASPQASVLGPLAALAAGINAYKAGQSAASPTSGALSGALGGALSGAAIGSMFGGPLIGGVAGGLLGGILGFLGGNSAKKKAEQQAIADAQARSRQYSIEGQLSGIDTQTQSGALQAFDIQAQQKRLDEQAAGNRASKELEADLAAQRQQIISQFAKQAAATEAQAEADRLKKIDDFNRAFNAAQGKGFLNDIGDLLTQIADFMTAGVDGTQANTLLQLQAQQIVDNAALTGDAFRSLLNVFPQLTGVLHEATTATTAQVTAQQQANSAAKGVVDYLNGLLAGPSSSLSPQHVLQNAQQVYNANLTQAQLGNLDAQVNFPKVADDLEKAAKAFYGSSAAYAAIRDQIVAQGLTLPTVTGSTDPVVNAIRDAITAIQIKGSATVDAIATMQGTLTVAVNSANPAATALALSTYFHALDPSGTGIITFASMQSALGGMVSNAALRDMFTRLDTDNSGGLTQMELQTAASNQVAADTAQVRALQASTNQLIDSANVTGVAAKGLLDQIATLTNSSVAQLNLLNAQYHAVTASASESGGGLVSTNNTMIEALNKIVLNTWATAQNTYVGVVSGTRVFDLPNAPSSGGTATGTLATGGVIPPHGLALVSEHSADGGRFLRAGAEPITVSPYAPANDNSALVSRVDRLTGTVERQTRTLAGLLVQVAKIAADGHSATQSEIYSQTRQLARAEARAALKPPVPGLKAA